NRNETQKIIMKIIDHRRKEIEDHKELGTISGGIETTANLLCFVIYHMAHHPNVLVRLREELDTIFDSDNNRQMTMEDLSKMRYTEAIIKECARLITPAKFAQRNSSLPDTIVDREWPANTAFYAYIEGIHHNPIHWKDPLKFNPDRFMDSEPQKNTFLMFGGGVRICPGRKLALITMKCLVSLIYKNLDITLVDMDAPLKLKNKLVNACTELKVRVEQREAHFKV
ncbi:2375_t:CDS:2, partial [Funneliformis caledonium]